MNERTRRRSLVDRLASPRFAAALIAALMALSALNVLVPQRLVLRREGWAQFAAEQPGLARVLETLGLDSIFTGWVIATLALLLLASLATCTFRRIRRHSAHSLAPVPTKPAGICSGPLRAGEGRDALAAARVVLMARGWRVGGESDSGAVLVKGRWGFWGSVLLHVSLALLLISGTFAYFTGFTGEMFITEGQQIQDVRESYRGTSREPRLGAAYTDALLTLESMEIGYEGATIVTAVANMSGIGRRGTTKKAVSVNHPMDVDGKSYLLQENGYSALLRLGAEGSAVQRVQLNLAERSPDGWTDSIALPGSRGEYVFRLTGRPSERSQRAGTPLRLTGGESLLVNVTKGDLVVWEGELQPGETASIPEFGTLGFEKMRLWARFMVRKQPERWWVYAALWGALLGTLWRFAVPERRIALVLGAGAGENRSIWIRWRTRPASPFGASEARDMKPILEAVEGYLSEQGGEAT